MIIAGWCCNKPVNLLLDSGATISLVSTRLVYMAGLSDKIRPTDKIITGLAQKVVPMRGEIYLKVTIGKQSLSNTFIVSDDIDSNLLASLGMFDHTRAGDRDIASAILKLDTLIVYQCTFSLDVIFSDHQSLYLFRYCLLSTLPLF